MNIEDEIVNYSSENVLDNNALVPLQRNLERSHFILRLERFAKWFLDILGGIVGTICLIPLTAIIWIANLISKDNGPVFYTQERIGKDGKIFKMYKYRSMVVGADEKLKEYLAENEEARKEYAEYKKLKNKIYFKK